MDFSPSSQGRGQANLESQYVLHSLGYHRRPIHRTIPAEASVPTWVSRLVFGAKRRLCGLGLLASIRSTDCVSICGYQAPLTLALHYAELQMNLSRDEAFWRRAPQDKGCRLREYSSVKAALTSWQCVILFASKALMHWIFGLCIRVDFRPKLHRWCMRDVH